MTLARYRWGELKARIAAMAVGDVVKVPAYPHNRAGFRPAPAARAYGRLYGYVLTQAEIAHDEDGKPIAFLRRTA